MIDPLSLAHEMEDAPAFERRVLSELQRSIGFDAAFLTMNGDPPTTSNIDAHRLDRAIEGAAYTRDLAPIKRAALTQGGVAVDTDVLGENRVRELGYHRDFAAPVRGRHSLIACLSLRGRPVGALMLGRTSSTFSASEIDRVRALLPSLSIARVSYRAPWRSEALPPASLDLLSRFVARFAARGDRSRWLERAAGHAADPIVVRERDGYREMVSMGRRGEFVWSRAHGTEPERSGWFYVDLFHLAAARAKNRGRTLLIGCGGAVVARQFASVYPGMHVDVVDCSAEVVDLARRWFALDDIPHVKVVVDDGVAFLARADEGKWDTIIIDAYGDSDLAPSLATNAFFVDLRRTLRPGGCFAFNVVGVLGEKGVLRDVERVARAVFDDVRLVPVLDPGESYAPSALRNVVVLGRTN